MLCIYWINHTNLVSGELHVIYWINHNNFIADTYSSSNLHIFQLAKDTEDVSDAEDKNKTPQFGTMFEKVNDEIADEEDKLQDLEGLQAAGQSMASVQTTLMKLTTKPERTTAHNVALRP